MRTDWRRNGAALLAAERRTREDEAPRLHDEVPRLRELSLQIDEYRNACSLQAARHTRRVVVATAPALFLLPCHEDRCEEGGYDFTYEIMRGLRSSLVEFSGEGTCPGRVGHDACGRVLRFTAHATYDSE